MSGLGYRIELEDHASLAATATPFKLTQTYSAPAAISHRKWKKRRNQRSLGSCTGASRSNIETVLNFIQTGGSIVELSMIYDYLQNQRECGMLGSDQGATIGGSCRAAMKSGACFEKTFPYPETYVTSIPRAAEAEGKQHVIKSHSVLRTYDDVLAWLASGVGCVQIGIPWTQGLVNAGPVIEYRNVKGGSYGGHALALEGYGGDVDKPKLDSQGRPYIDMENSHGNDWADDGWSLVAPEVIDYWLGQGNTFIGLSDLTTFGPRAVPTYRGITQ